MARGDHVFCSCKICKQTYIITQKYARHLTGDTGSTGRCFLMCVHDSKKETTLKKSMGLIIDSILCNLFVFNILYKNEKLNGLLK